MKPLYILALVAALASVVLGVMNRSKFIDYRKQKDESNRLVMTNFEATEAINTESSDLIGKWNEQNKARDAAQFATKTETDTFNSKEKDDKEAIAMTETTQKAIDDTKQKIKDKLGEFGTPEELQAKIDGLKKETEDQAKQLEVAEKELQVTNAVVADNEKTIGRFREQQTQRDKTITLGTREGLITAVNPDWAFVVVNMGKSQGVNTDSRLLVKRGSSLVGKLKIIQIENNLTIADIDAKSIKEANGIQPGDQVIFDNSAN